MLPALFLPWRGGLAPAASRRTVGRIPHASQWVNVPDGASGSSTRSANERVPRGGLVHRSAGGRFAPSQLYRAGIV